MKKRLLILALTLAIYGCSKQSVAPDTQTQASSSLAAASSSSSVSSSIGTTVYKGVPCTEAPSTQSYLPDAGFAMTFPCGWDVMATGSRFENRHGSFVHYEFLNKHWDKNDTSPFFNELHFVNEDSAPEQKPDCYDTCVDTRTKAEYRKLKSEWNTGKSEREVKTLGGSQYLVDTESWPGEDSYLREYTTFIGDIEIDMWVVSENGRQDAESDTLVSKIQFAKKSE